MERQSSPVGNKECGTAISSAENGERGTAISPGRYYQLLSGHAATGDYLCSRMHKLTSDRCWWCGRDERQSRHHLFVNCEAWKPQIQELWKK